MLQHFGSCDCALFGDMPNQEQRDLLCFGDLLQGSGAGAHLGDRARRVVNLRRVERLHRVDNSDDGLCGLNQM